MSTVNRKRIPRRYSVVTANTQNLASVVSGPCKLLSISVTNVGTNIHSIKLADHPSVYIGDITTTLVEDDFSALRNNPVLAIPTPSTSTFTLSWPDGIPFSTGIYIAIVRAIAPKALNVNADVSAIQVTLTYAEV